MILEVSASGFSVETAGGGERYFSGLAEYLESQGVGISWASIPKKSIGKNFSIGSHGEIHANIAGILHKTNPIPTLKTIMDMKVFMSRFENEINIIHIHNFRTISGALWTILSKFAKKRRDIKMILTDHGSMFAPFPRYLIKDFDYYAPVCELSNSYLQKLMPKPFQIVRTFVTDDFIKLNLNKTFEDRNIDILFVGRILPVKGIDKILDLGETLKNSGFNDIQIRIAGNPFNQAYFEKLKNMINAKNLSSNVKILTGVNDNGIIELYNSSRLFVHLGSETDIYGRRYAYPELSPIVLLEALSFGLPIISTKTHSTAIEANLGGGEVFVVEPNDHDKIFNLAKKILEDRVTWNKISSKNREYVINERTLSKIGAEFLKFINSIMEE
ncbi:MAG: glycosyltransferase [Candidatus Rehaiarchaeum fermentans]|nr:glycosyltransferase [Candidatus Rehaiarchaeum fermentans]